MKFIRLIVLLVICVPVLFVSCKKTTQLGVNTLPANDFVNAVSTDTMTVLAQEETELPVETNSLLKYLLGSMKDPIFGNSYAGIFTQVQTLNNFSFSDSSRVDSMILSLPFNSSPAYYGIQNIPQTIRVYQVTQSMSPTTIYYSNQTFSYNPVPIGTITFTPNVASYATDSPTILGFKLSPQLRIKLSGAFIQELTSQSNAGIGTFYDNSTFQNFLKGLYIAPDTSSGFGSGIMYLNMSAAQIVVYGKEGNNVPTEIGFFPINSATSACTGYYKHNYNGTPVQSLLKSNAANDTVLYLQSMQGLRAKITIPYLKNLGKVLINRAELEAVQVNQQNTLPIIDTNFSAPASVEVVTDSLNNDYAIEDYDNPFLTYGGTKIKIQDPSFPNDSIADYNVSLADQLQYMLTGNPTASTINYNQFTSLFLRTFPNPEIADRIVIGGSNSKKYKLVLHLIYTKLQ